MDMNPPLRMIDVAIGGLEILRDGIHTAATRASMEL
jgi:hypothetical protein